ncbi:hypothetical protein L1987_11805 [Smallanthus sonchifolius]|uniref:Uncharacterized protein n=1 Tax=Smallanthus sonchifolius TaxID=185202 RepID=A0ACB9JC02_9ASTR|nr:hypothetical protein L1987_11805 [Smallanthus sonchifolius]
MISLHSICTCTFNQPEKRLRASFKVKSRKKSWFNQSSYHLRTEVLLDVRSWPLLSSNVKWFETDVLKLDAAVESNTIHPIGKDILEAARVAKCPNVKVKQFICLICRRYPLGTFTSLVLMSNKK